MESIAEASSDFAWTVPLQVCVSRPSRRPHQTKAQGHLQPSPLMLELILLVCQATCATMAVEFGLMREKMHGDGELYCLQTKDV